MHCACKIMWSGSKCNWQQEVVDNCLQDQRFSSVVDFTHGCARVQCECWLQFGFDFGTASQWALYYDIDVVHVRGGYVPATGDL